jgi:hypothetical protein
MQGIRRSQREALFLSVPALIFIVINHNFSLRHFEFFCSKANKDITAAAVAAATMRGEKLIPMYETAPTTMLLNPLNSDEFASDGSANLILPNTPLNNHAHDDFTSAAFT